jgi:hypothetical protein
MGAGDSEQLNDLERTKLQVEAWKTTVQVQQHFNDIEMKIRSLAITVLTAVLAAAAVAIKNGTKLDVSDHGVPLGSALLLVGAITWGLFFFVDKIWSNRRASFPTDAQATSSTGTPYVRSASASSSALAARLATKERRPCRPSGR